MAPRECPIRAKVCHPSCIQDAQQFGQVIPDLVARIGRPAIAAAMAGEINGNDMVLIEQRRKHFEAGGIIQPTMQRQ